MKLKRTLTVLMLALTVALCGAFYACVDGEQSGNQSEAGNPDGGEESVGDGDILVAYFSCTGNTEEVAGILANESGGTLFEIVPEIPYSSADLNYNNPDSRTSIENADPSARPAIANAVEDMPGYEAVFIGYPIWHGIAPRIIQTFLEEYDFSDKAIYIFSTSASNGGGTAFGRLQSTYAELNFADYLHCTSSQLSSAQTRVQSWLNETGVL